MNGLEKRDSLRRRFKRNPNVVFRRIGDECVLVPISSNTGDVNNIYSLSEVAADIWEMLAPGTTLNIILEELLNSYDVSEGQAKEDLFQFIEDLLGIKAIEEI